MLVASVSALAVIASTAAAQEVGSGSAPANEKTAPAANPGGNPNATPPAGAAPSVSEVVVTGTRIRGVAPVGSEIVQLDQGDIQRSGLSSTANLIEDVPSVLSLGSGNAFSGGAAQSGDTLNSLTYGKSPNIRGFGPQATLSLVNGHRMAYEGSAMNEFDPDNYPVQMISRVDVVQDGTSPLYGADAIAGTVNYILRKPENTIETYAGYGTTTGQDTWYTTGIVGHTWDSGGFIASYEHTYQSALPASAHSSLYTDDFSPYGGSPAPDFAAPGNVVVNGVDYAIPAGQNGQSLTLSQLGAAGVANRQNSWTGMDAMPLEQADHFALNLEQNLTPWLQLIGDALYSSSSFSLNYPEGFPLPTDVTAAIPNSNPYSPCNPSHYAGGTVTGPAALVAACNTGSLQVDYSDLYDSGAQRRWGHIVNWDATGGFRAKLPYEWTATLLASDESDSEPSYTDYIFTPPFPAGTYNVFCDPHQFTCNPSSVTSTLPGGPQRAGLEYIHTGYQDQDLTFNADGPLFELPGGKVRLAVGGEYYNAKFANENTFGENVADRRFIRSAYGELFVPIVGTGNSFPGVYKLELDVAGRIDDYSDVGTTTNPKVGVNWWVNPDLKIHGSYGTSFRAPGLSDNDPTVQVGVIPDAAIGVSPTICPTCASAGSAAAGYFLLGGANHDLTPETSTSYSIGADWNPRFIHGLSASINYWNVTYNNQVNEPIYNAGLVGSINQGYNSNYIIYNPTYFPALATNNPVAFFGDFPQINQSDPNCAAVYNKKVTTQALFNDMLSCVNAGNGAGPLLGAPTTNPNELLAFEDGHRLNAGSTDADGLDLSLYYTMHDSLGQWRVGGVGEYILDWDVSSVPSAPLTNEVNHFLYPLRYKMRAELSWSNGFDFGKLAGSLFVNYENSYQIDQDLLPSTVSSSYTHIGSYTTVDLTASYNTGDVPRNWVERNLSFTISVQNLFDESPPLVINEGGAAGPGLLFDPANASPLGRVIQFQIGKRW